MFILRSILFIILFSNIAYSQNIFRAIVKDSSSGEVLIGLRAHVKATDKGAISNSQGEITIKNVPNGEQTIVFSYIGFQQKETKVIFPIGETLTILMIPKAEDTEEIIITGTRTNKSIANTPTRVEVLTEEIDEASTMDPSKIAHLITHSTGIQVQQTSATSNTANVRIQGLDGRYTQILKDGFPLYGGFSGSLSIMQIPPLDLRQVEYIKGGASTLFGGGAISGLINLISKEPENNETLLHCNISHIGAFDVNAFYSAKSENIGITLLGQRNTHRFFDADNDGFTDMPQLVKNNFNPKLFFTLDTNTTLMVGATFTDEIRTGGDTQLLSNFSPDTNHFYKEQNDVKRITTQLSFEHTLSKGKVITFRNSLNFFERSLSIIPSRKLEEYRFSGNQLSSFSEFSYSSAGENDVFITGINYYSDDFKEDSLSSRILRTEIYKTIGVFANFTTDISNALSLETGLRCDYVLNGTFFVLPRISALIKWSQQLATRVGGGMGYRNPTIFNQEAELLAYKNILSIDKNSVEQEKSYGGNVDISYKIPIGESFFINVNQMFFYTYLNNPLILTATSSPTENYNFINMNGYVQSAGAETFFKFGFYDFVLFVGYTYTNAISNNMGTVAEIPLTPKHSLKGDLLYSLPGTWRVGLDYEYKSSQVLSNGRKTMDYWTFGAVVEYTYESLTIFGNVENYTDMRQTRYESLVSLPNNTPQLTEVWMPLDGIVFNTGFKLRL